MSLTSPQQPPSVHTPSQDAWTTIKERVGGAWQAAAHAVTAAGEQLNNGAHYMWQGTINAEDKVTKVVQEDAHLMREATAAEAQYLWDSALTAERQVVTSLHSSWDATRDATTSEAKYLWSAATHAEQELARSLEESAHRAQVELEKATDPSVTETQNAWEALNDTY